MVLSIHTPFGVHTPAAIHREKDVSEETYRRASIVRYQFPVRGEMPESVVKKVGIPRTRNTSEAPLAFLTKALQTTTHLMRSS